MCGCFFSCPPVKEGSPKPWQIVEHVVEAYYDDFCYYGAAGNVVLNPNPWNGEMYEDFLNPLEASRAATMLRHEVIMDNEIPFSSIILEKVAIPSPTSSRHIKQGKVRFSEEVEISLSFNDTKEAGIETIFTHKQIQEWNNKPWKLRAQEETGSELKNGLQSHVLDRWCIVDQTLLMIHGSNLKEKPWSFKNRRSNRRQSPLPLALAAMDSKPQYDGVDTDPEPRTGFSTFDDVQCHAVDYGRPLGHAFASTRDEVEMDSIVTRHTKKKGLLHIETFGYQQRYIGQRRTTVRGDEIPRWREKVRLLWNDHYDSPPFLTFPIRPPVTTAEATISVIVQMGQVQPGRALVLAQKVHDGGSSDDPVVISAPYFTTRGAVLDFAEVPQELQGTAVLRQGFVVWRTGFQQRLQDGDFLRILLDDTEAEGSALMQTELTSQGTMWRTWPEQPEDYLALREIRLNEEQQDEPTPDEGDIILHDPDQWLRLITATQRTQRHQITLQVHGLLHRGIGMRRVTLPHFSLFAIQEATRSLWPQFIGLNKKAYLVQPQPDLPPQEGEDVTVILEFVDQWHQPDANTVPLLQECFLPYTVEINRIAAYSPLILSAQLLQIDPEFCPTATPSTRIDFWLCHQSLAAERRIIAKPGGLLTIRVSTVINQQGPQISLSFPGGLQFAQHMAELTSLCDKTSATWTFVGATEPGNPATLDYLDTEWAKLHDPYRVMHFFSNLLGNRGLNVEDYVLYHVPSHAINATTFVYGKRDNPGCLAHFVYSAKWDESWKEQYCHVVPVSTTTIDIAARVGLQEYTWNLFLNGRPADHHLNLYNGVLLEFELEDEQTSNESGYDNHSNSQDSTSPSRQTDESALGQFSVAPSTTESFGITPWPTFTFPSTSTSVETTTRLVRTCKPNPALGTDFDEELPYRTRNVENGRIYERQVPPPNWAEIPILGIAINHDAVARDNTGHLFVHLRTWLVFHDRESPEEHRDGQIRAQLMVNLHEKLRQIWREHIDPQDQIRSFVVRPTPALGRGERPKLLLIIECNRPQISEMRPILVTYQQLDERGISPEIWWKPLLVPQLVNLQILADGCPMDCEPHHIVAPLGTEDRRWMTRNQNRPMVRGRYIPVWWDMRRRPPPPSQDEPTQDQDIEDEVNMMQRQPQQEAEELITPEETYTIAHTFHMSTSYKLAQIERTPGLTMTDQLTRLWQPPRSEAIVAIHEVMEPPQDLQNTADSTLLIEMSHDALRRVTEDDCLMLVDIQLADRRLRAQGIKLRKVIWSRLRMTRAQILHALSAHTLCDEVDMLCTLWHNKVHWPDTDLAHRHMRNGDFLHLLIRSSDLMTVKEIYHGLCSQEEADTSRYLYHPSPVPSPQATSEEETPRRGREEDEQESERRSRSRTRSISLLQRSTHIKTTTASSLAESTRRQESLSTLTEVNHSHVNDRWCSETLLTRTEGMHNKIIQLETLVAPPIWLRIPIGDVQFLTTQIAGLDLGAVGGTAQVVKWHESTLQWFQYVQPWQQEIPLKYHLFTDGSSVKHGDARHGAAAVVLIVETIVGLRWGGSRTYQVCDSPTAPKTEIVAMVMALLWGIQLGDWHPHSDIPFMLALGYDCMLAGHGAAGQWQLKAHAQLQTHGRALALWIEQRFRTTIEWQHIPSHTGHPWNEAADALSWATVHQWIPAMYAEDILQQLDIGDGCATSWLWMLEAAQQKIPGMPCIENQHFLINVSAPHEEKPQVQGHPFKMRQLTESPGTVRQEMMTSIRLATVNVLTLYDIGKYGRGYISARQEAIMKQMKEEDLHIIGIQESRSTCDGYLHTDDFHVLSAPSTTKGSGGVQLWIRKVFNLSHRSMALHASDFKILHATSRRLTVRIEARWLKLIVVVGHAPASSGYEESFRFWQATTTSIPKKYHEWDTVYLCDANARIGSITTESVGGHGAEEENPSGSAFHQWMFEQELVVPQSFEAHHVGSHHTWTHARGPSARLDFIVLDKSLLSKEVTTWISDTIDVTTKRDDHQCVCVPQFRGKSGMQRLINRREVVVWQQSR